MSRGRWSNKHMVRIHNGLPCAGHRCSSTKRLSDIVAGNVVGLNLLAFSGNPPGNFGAGTTMRRYRMFPHY